MYLIFTQVSDLTLLLNEARDQNVLNIKNFCFANLFFVPHNCSALIEENHLEKIFWKYETKDSMDDRDNGFSPNLGQIPSFVNIFVNFSDHGNVVTAKDVKTKHDLKQTCF